MEVLDIGKEVFAVITSYDNRALNYLNIHYGEIQGVRVDREFRVTYDFGIYIVTSCDVFETKEEAIARAREIINESTKNILGDDLTMQDIMSNDSPNIKSVVSDEIAINQCMIMDRVIRCVNDEENGIFEDWITLHVPDGCSRDEWADLIEGRVQEAYLEACEFFARHMSNLIAKGAWSDKGYTLELFNRDEHYFDDVVGKDKDEGNEFE